VYRVVVSEQGTGPVDANELTFDPVWLILKKVRPNFHTPSYFAPGKLTIGDRRARFGPSAAALVWPTWRPNDISRAFDEVIAVRRKRHGWGLVPRFVEITYQAEDGPAVAYFNDGGWYGWRPLLTGSNRRMVNAIREHLGVS
jgi:hypothetical protein